MNDADRFATNRVLDEVLITISRGRAIASALAAMTVNTSDAREVDAALKLADGEFHVLVDTIFEYCHQAEQQIRTLMCGVPSAAPKEDAS